LGIWEGRWGGRKNGENGFVVKSDKRETRECPHATDSAIECGAQRERERDWKRERGKG
jgi:hypothetical protein